MKVCIEQTPRGAARIDVERGSVCTEKQGNAATIRVERPVVCVTAERKPVHIEKE